MYIYIIRIVLGIWSGEIILIEWELTSGNHFHGLLEDNHLVRWFSAINLHLYRWCSIVALDQRSILIHELEILFLINQCSWMTRVNSALFCPERFSDELATLMFVCHLFCCHVMLLLQYYESKNILTVHWERTSSQWSMFWFVCVALWQIAHGK